MKTLLQNTEAHLVCGQELRVLADDLPAASAWALRRGWHAVWVAAAPSLAGGPSSGGVAMFARDWIGLRPYEAVQGDGGSVAPHRLVAAVAEADGYNQILVGSGYLQSGEGTNEANLDILGRWGQTAGRWGGAWLLGADFQNTPSEISGTGFHEEARCDIVAPDTRGTCRASAGTWRVIDFFLVEELLASGIEKVEASHRGPPHPHVPVTLTFQARLASTQALRFPSHEFLPLRPRFGPRTAAPSYAAVKGKVVQLLADLRFAKPDGHTCQRRVDSCYATWSRAAVQEVAQVTGTEDLRDPSSRGRTACLMWVSVIAPPRPPPFAAAARTRADQLQWILCRFHELEAGHLEDANGVGSEEGLLHPPPWVQNTDPATLGWFRSAQAMGVQLQDARTAGADPPAADPVDFEALFDALQSAQAEAVAEEGASWRAWVEEAFAGGAGPAHAVTREPAAWLPQTTTKRDGQVTADPLHLLADQGAIWHPLWEAQPQEPEEGELPWLDALNQEAGALAPLAPPHPDEIRTVLRAARESTGKAMDGWHLRHLLLLCDEALAILALFWMILEVAGLAPSCVRRLLVFLLAKPTGGYRPIALFPSFYRAWGRCRRRIADCWEQEHPREYFAVSTGRSVTDGVWRAAVRAEAGANEGAAAGSFMGTSSSSMRRSPFPSLSPRQRGGGSTCGSSGRRWLSTSARASCSMRARPCAELPRAVECQRAAPSPPPGCECWSWRTPTASSAGGRASPLTSASTTGDSIWWATLPKSPMSSPRRPSTWPTRSLSLEASSRSRKLRWWPPHPGWPPSSGRASEGSGARPSEESAASASISPLDAPAPAGEGRGSSAHASARPSAGLLAPRRSLAETRGQS